MVKFATTLHQKTGVIANNGTHNQKHQQQKKVGNLNLQPTTVHIQVQHGKNGQQHISLQPNDFGGTANVVTNDIQGNGVVQLQSPSHHRALLTQNIKIQQSPTNIQVYAQQLGRPGDSPKVIKASPSMQQVLLTSLAPTSPVGNRTTTSFATITTPAEQTKSTVNGQKLNGGVSGTTTTTVTMKNTAAATNTNRQKLVNNRDCHYSGFPKPAYSNACLIALALKNSRTGQLSVQEIYKFLCEHFPFFNTAPQGWKNSVRHALSMNKCFQKIPDPRPKSSSSTENGSSTILSSGGGAPNQTSAVKGFLWLLNPSKITRMEEELAKWTKKDTEGIKKGMRYPYKLEALIRGEVVKSYKVKPIRGSVDSEDMESSEEELEQDMMTISNHSNNLMLGNFQPQDFETILNSDLGQSEYDGKNGMMGVVRATNSIMASEGAAVNKLIQQQSSSNISIPNGLGNALKKRHSAAHLNLGKRKRRSGLEEDEFCCLTCNFKSGNMDELLQHFQNSKCNKLKNKSCSGSFTVGNGNNANTKINGNNKFWTKITKGENSEGDEDTESEEDEEYQCPVCPTVVNCKEDFLKHFENYHNGEDLDLDAAMKDSFTSDVTGIDGIFKGAANRLINADGSLPYKIIEENMVPTNRGEYVKRMRQQQQEPTNVTPSINDHSMGRQNSLYSNISDLSRSTSTNSSSSMLISGSNPNQSIGTDDSFISKMMGNLEQDDMMMMGNCHDIEQRSRRLSQESSSCESLTSNDFMTDSDDIEHGLSTFTSSSASGLRAIGVETLLSGGSTGSTLMDRGEWIEEEWDLSQFLIAPPQPELDMVNGFSSELQF